jgi:hypothetical protein
LKEGGHSKARFVGWKPAPEKPIGVRCSTWNRDSPSHLQSLRTVPRETFCRRGAVPECSTWNIDLGRAAYDCESGEFLREITEISHL